MSRFDRFAKRALDIIAASIGLILFSPLFLAVAVMIKLHWRGPIFDRQTHYGYNNEKIRLLRFRSTTDRCGDSGSEPVRSISTATLFGCMLRRSKIDELPQLINVLRGEMSVVGPHPSLSNPQVQIGQISGLSRGLKPGLISWAQLNGYRNETDTLQRGRIQFDVEYFQKWSILLDLKIVMMTFFSRDSY